MKRFGLADNRLRALVLAMLALIAGGALAAPARAAEGLSITDVYVAQNATGARSADAVVKLDGWLAVVLSGNISITDAAKPTLMLDGAPIAGLKPSGSASSASTLVFQLARSGENAQLWKPILGSPTTLEREVTVGVLSGGAMIAAADGVPKPKLVIMSSIGLITAVVVIALVFVAVWAVAAKTNLLKDSLLPQLEPKKQPYSLGRWQMAVWFTLIFAAFIFLFIILGDYDTLTTQSLILMGMSAATAGFAIAVDASKDTPIGAANETLQAIGLRTYRDVVALRIDIGTKQAALAAVPAPTPDQVLLIQTQITDRLNTLRIYKDVVSPFVSRGWLRDLTTDINGPALHRLQMLVWTLTIGGLFVIEVYQSLTMPAFSSTLLGLMGVTSAGYIGFKFPEKQN